MGADKRAANQQPKHFANIIALSKLCTHYFYVLQVLCYTMRGDKKCCAYAAETFKRIRDKIVWQSNAARKDVGLEGNDRVYCSFPLDQL